MQMEQGAQQATVKHTGISPKQSKVPNWYPFSVAMIYDLFGRKLIFIIYGFNIFLGHFGFSQRDSLVTVFLKQ